MSKVTGNELLSRSLHRLGVETLFFLSGGPINDVIFGCQSLGIRCIDVRDERAAALMAQAYARVTGKPGIAIASPAGATTNMATGLGSAFLDCAPVIAIGGSCSLAMRETGAFEEIDVASVMRPITKQSWVIPRTERIPAFAAMAFRHALSGRPGPVFLECPGDVLYGRVEEGKVTAVPESVEMARPSGDPQAVHRAIELLAQAERPVIISGSGVLWAGAWEELGEFVELTNIPFYTTPLGRGAIPEDHRLAFLAARTTAWREADVVLAIGTRANFIVEHFQPPRFDAAARFIVVNTDAEEIGHNRPVEVGIVGDARLVLRQLIEEARDRFQGREKLPWVDRLRRKDAERRSKLEPLLNSEQVPIHPLRLCKEVRDFLPRDCILAVDGHETLLFARQAIPVYGPRQRLNPGPFAAMGVGVPFGVGAKAARPERPVAVLTGDGAFGFNAMEIDTAVRHKLPLLIVINNNGGWSNVRGMPPISRDLGFSAAYERLAEALGGYGERVEEPSRIRPALERAAASGLPAVVNVITDAEASAEARYAFAAALVSSEA